VVVRVSLARLRVATWGTYGDGYHAPRLKPSVLSLTSRNCEQSHSETLLAYGKYFGVLQTLGKWEP
jgi:hypothetical protein